MEADSEPIVRGKRISDLKVADLKRELKKHSLPKDGKKAELVRRLTLFFQENGVAGVQRGKAVMPSMLDSSREEDPTSTEADTADERESHEDVEKSAEKLSRTRMEPTLNETFVTSAEEAEDGEQHPGNLTRVSVASVNLSLSRTPRARRRTSLLRASFLKEINMDSDGSLVQDEASTHKDRRRSSKMGRNSFMSENHDKAPTPKDRRRSSKLHRKSFMSEDEPKDEQEWMSEDDEDMEVDDAPQAVVAPAPPIQEPKPAMPPHPAAVQRSVSKGPMTAGPRFAKAHAKLEDNMENIKDYKERIKKRHEAHERNVPTVVQRLATPKSVASKRVTRRAAAAAAAASDSKKTGNAEGFRFTTMDIDQANFQFGRLSTSKIATIQKAPPKPSAIPTNIHRIARPVTRKEMDVKVRTMIRQPLKPTQEVASSSKSNVPMTVKKVEPKAVKRSYTPRLGRMEKFMDTTKLTDDQYAVVMDEGIVKPVGSAKRAHNTAMLREEDAVARKRRRDLLLAARRKLEI